jgi:hypothetical protein
VLAGARCKRLGERLREAGASGVPPTRCPGWLSACIRVLIVSTGYMAMCSTMPATAPAIMCCGCSGVAVSAGSGRAAAALARSAAAGSDSSPS